MPELTVASFNLHWGRGRRRLGYPLFDVVAACKQLDTDVLVVQESWAPDEGTAQHDEIAATLGYEVAATRAMARVSMWPEPEIAARGSDPADGGTGTWNLALLTRLPILRTDVVALPVLWPDPVHRALLLADLDVAGTRVTVCGAHLPHLQFGAPLNTPHVRRGLPSADSPAILAGDMNMWGWTIDLMTGAGWRRVVRGGRTFPAHWPLFQIDHILATPLVDALAGEVVPVPGSDHLPVRAALRV